MTRRQIALALLATLAAIGAFSTALAQELQAVKNAYENHEALRYSTTVVDGGTTTRDLLQEASNACTSDNRAFEAGKKQLYVTGSPTLSELTALRDAAVASCGALKVFGDSVRAALVAYEETDKTYECKRLNTNCSDGGVDGG